MWAWWCTSIIPVLVRLKQEDREFKARLDYMRRHCIKPLPYSNQVEMGVWLSGRALACICEDRFQSPALKRGEGREQSNRQVASK
jgi:hypothetical protein